MSAQFHFREFFEAAEIVDDGRFEGLAGVDTDKPGSLAFVENATYLERALSNPNISGVILTRTLYEDHEQEIGKPTVVVENPRFRFWALHNHLVKNVLIGLKIEPHRGSCCSIHRSAVIGDKVVIGDRVTIGPNAVIEDYSVIEEGVIVSAGAVIGAEGLQAYRDEGRPRFVRHAGGVQLGEGVSVLAQAVVSKAVFPSFTVVGAGTHLSLLSSVGHESRIGRNCLIAGNVLIGGSVTIGDDVVIGPSATVKDGVKVGAGARIRIGSVVVVDVPAGGDVSGNFALNHTRHLRRYARNSSRDDV